VYDYIILYQTGLVSDLVIELI